MIEYLPAAIQGVGSVINAISGRKNRTPKFENTAFGKYIKQVSEQGAYSPNIQQQILNQLSSKVSAIAQTRRARTRGYLTSRGMGDSVAGASLLDEPGQDVQRTLGNEAQDLLVKNALSKIQAGREYVAGINQTDAIRRGENKAITGGLIGGLAGVVGSAADAYQYKQLLDRLYPKQKKGETDDPMGVFDDLTGFTDEEVVQYDDWLKSQGY